MLFIYSRLRAAFATCALLLGSVAGAATAQAIPPASQTTSAFSLPPGLNANQIYYSTWELADRHVVLYVEPGTPARMTTVQVNVLDTTLRVLHQRTLTLRGRCQPVTDAPTKAAGHLLYQFRQRLRNGVDSTLNVVFDPAGNVTTMRQLAYKHPNSIDKLSTIWSLQQPTANFVLRKRGTTKKSFSINSVTPDLRLRWSQEISSPRGFAALDDYAADSSHLWLLVRENAGSRRNASVAVCLDLATGRVLSRTPLLTPNSKGVRETAACAMGPDHSVVITGQAFRGRRPKGARMGDLFVLRFRPDGSRLTDRQVLLPREKTHWRHVLSAADGAVRIVGETYTSTSFGANFAIGLLVQIATLGTLSISQTTIRPRDIVVATLDSAGTVQQFQHAELSDGGSLTVGGHLPARRIARLADNQGFFRFRSYTEDATNLLLRSESRVLQIGLADMRPVTLREQPDRCRQELVAAYGHQMVVLEFNRQTDTFSLQRLRL